jgi:hypothetical protein
VIYADYSGHRSEVILGSEQKSDLEGSGEAHSECVSALVSISLNFP